MRKVSEEAQLNHFVLLREDKCVIDAEKLIVPNEEMPKIPVAFPSALTQDVTTRTTEATLQGIVNFVNETEAL
jgi:hypothetical protein